MEEKKVVKHFVKKDFWVVDFEVDLAVVLEVDVTVMEIKVVDMVVHWVVVLVVVRKAEDMAVEMEKVIEVEGGKVVREAEMMAVFLDLAISVVDQVVKMVKAVLTEDMVEADTKVV